MQESEGLQVVYADNGARKEQPGLEYRPPVDEPMSMEYSNVNEKANVRDKFYAVSTGQNKGLIYSNAGGDNLRPRERTYCGLSKRAFIIIICAALGIIIVAAAVGGGVGGALSKKSSSSTVSSSSSSISAAAASATTSSSSSKTTSATSTSKAAEPTPFPSSGFVALDCPALNTTTYTSSSTTFEIFCGGLNYVQTTNAIQGYNHTTIDACMDQCVTFNTGSPRTACAGITFQGNLTEAEQPAQRANCWLAGTAGISTAVWGTGALVASAAILS